MDFHRAHFGDAVMEDESGNTSPGDGGDDQSQSNDQDQSSQDKDQDEKLGGPGKRALNAEREARKQAEKELQAAQSRVKELEDATKSDGEKQSERLQELEQSDRQKDTTIASLQADLMRFRVAAAEGLDLEAAERLRGTTEDEIRADAKAFAAKFGTARPGEVPGAGARGSDNPNVTPGLGRLQSAYATTSN